MNWSVNNQPHTTLQTASHDFKLLAQMLDPFSLLRPSDKCQESLQKLLDLCIQLADRALFFVSSDKADDLLKNETMRLLLAIKEAVKDADNDCKDPPNSDLQQAIWNAARGADALEKRILQGFEIRKLKSQKKLTSGQQARLQQLTRDWNPKVVNAEWLEFIHDIKVLRKTAQKANGTYQPNNSIPPLFTPIPSGSLIPLPI